MSHDLVLEDLIFQNFLSFGSEPIQIRLDTSLLTIILGENRDGGEGERNGAGKSSITDAIAYALFGKCIRDLPNKNLWNYHTGEAMLVVLHWHKDGFQYRVERGENPGRLKFYRRPEGSDVPWTAKNDKREPIWDITRDKTRTTQDIIRAVGLDLMLFEVLVVNSSESTPFFQRREDERRDMVERLFGFTILSEKAEALKEERKEKNKALIVLESAANATRQANLRVETEIEHLLGEAAKWDQDKARRQAYLQSVIARIEKSNPDEEIEILQALEELEDKITETRNKANLKKQKHETVIMKQGHLVDTIQREVNESKRELNKLEIELTNQKKIKQNLLSDGNCPECGQSLPNVAEHIQIHDSEIKRLVDLIEPTKIKVTRVDLPREIKKLEELKKQKFVDPDLEALLATKKEIGIPELTYSSVVEAVEAKTNLSGFRTELTDLVRAVNPHTDGIERLKKNAIKRIDQKEIEELRELIDHYNFLIEILTDKDSFIRKSILSRWIPKLNARINHYLERFELPYRVEFNPDTTCSIIRDDLTYAYNALSRGQRSRVWVATNWAFRDVFETMNFSINTLFVDELLDAGLSDRGASIAFDILEENAKKLHKGVFLITHRQDLADRSENTMLVEMEYGISTILQAA